MAGKIMLFLRLHENDILVLEIFRGLWLMPFSRFVFESGFIPLIPGVLLIINGIAYIIDSFIFLLFHGCGAWVSNITKVFEILGEPLMILWLLAIGAKTKELTSSDAKN